MDASTKSEALFERFLIVHGLPFARVPVAKTPRPDFVVGAQAEYGPLFFEIKEITADDGFASDRLAVSSRTVGDHIRSKISESKKQIRYGASLNRPSILLVYNALDTKFHLFGTEDHDFRAAMSGEWTLQIGAVSGALLQVGNGRNRSLREKRNTSFSALGHIAPGDSGLTVRLFPNMHAKVPLPVNIPACFQIVV